MRCALGAVPLSIVLVCTTPSATLAQTSQKAEARRHYESGLSLVKSKTYGEAIAEFNQAYDMGHGFAVQYDIGRAYVAIDEPVLAIKAMRKYLVEGGKRIASSRRKQVVAEIAKQERLVVSVSVHAELDGAVLKVDGAEVGKTPLPDGLQVKAGAHLFSASAAGYQPWEQRMDAVGGERRILEIHFEPIEATAAVPQPAASPSAPNTLASTPPAAPTAVDSAEQGQSPTAGATSTQVTEPAPGTPRPRKLAAYVLATVGIGALAVGGVFGVLAISKRHDSDAECPQNQCSAAGVALNDQARMAARVADITIGAGLVTVVVATYLLLRTPQSEGNPPAATARGVRLLAEVGPGKAGLALRGSW